MRFKNYYDIDFPNSKYFDLIIDTTDKSPEEIVEEILDKVK